MTIQRQYSLPNCKLVLQGLSSETATTTSGRPLLSMVTNVECHLAGQKVPLTGGRAFLDSLVLSVSDYAQGYLSGIRHLIHRDRRQQTGLVQIEQVGDNLHCLTVQPEAEPAEVQAIDLTTVQFFDLVEAIDQMVADAQTLPDLAPKLEPLSRRYVVSQEPIAKRAAPAAIGITGLAAAAALLFMLPVPEARRPQSISEEASTEQSSPTASPAGEATTSPPASPPTESPTPEASPEATGSPVPPSTAAVQGTGLSLDNAPEITDPAELDRLTVQLYDRLDLDWKKNPTFDGELVYRVGVNQSGEIVGYKFANDAALTYLSDVPLADVQFGSTAPPSDGSSTDASPDAAETAPKQPIAQFRVVFKSDGVLEVSPWDGQPTDPEVEASPTPSP
ncbi:MAG: DUF4335 domain-containing protein [Leptolyngbya sp. IPPAS B-1204]|nr:MAG: DUF4335 domain-containing protein [Leptolyngbya sp. IPPAS B-1204]